MSSSVKFGLNHFHRSVNYEETLSKYAKMQGMTLVEDSRLQVTMATRGPVSPSVHCVLPRSSSCYGIMALLPVHIMPWHELCVWPKPEQELHELPDPSSILASPPVCKTYEDARPNGANEF